MKKGDLSKFIERAVQKEMLTQTAAELKQRNADLTLTLGAGDKSSEIVSCE